MAATPLSPAVRWVLSNAAEALFLAKLGGTLFDRADFAQEIVPIRRLVPVWSRSGEDAVQTHFDFLNVTGGDADDTWVQADFETIETAFMAFWDDVKTMYSPSTVLDQLRWYNNSSPPAGGDHPAVRVVEKNDAGTAGAGNPLPGQCALVISLVSSSRRHWGRVYMPAPAASALGSDGRLYVDRQTELAAAAHTFLRACVVADLHPVVASGDLPGAFGVQSLFVDNSFDTQRRRKNESTARTSYVLTS